MDTIVETHDRIVGKTWREAKSRCDASVAAAKSAMQDTLQGFSTLGSALLEAHGDEMPLENAVQISVGWPSLESLVATATQLTTKLAADPLAHVVHGYHRFRRYGPRMLRALDIRAAAVAEPLFNAAKIIGGTDKTVARPLTFLRRGSKWYRHLNAAGDDGLRLWEVAVLCHLRETFRSGDVWLAHSRRYGDLKDALVPVEVARAVPKLTMPLEPEDWLADRKRRLTDGLQRLAKAARIGAIPGGSIENGVLKIDRLTSAVPAEADALILDLYGRLPDVRVTDLLQEVDGDIGFTEAFTHLRTGVPCKDRIGLLNALLAYRFIPRIRDLPSKRLYLCDPASAPAELRGLIGGKIRERLIIDNWPDILRAVATMAAGVMPPSQLLKKFASYPRQHELALALREIGRVERTLFIIEWLLDTDMQRRAQIGLNKGAAHHALKNALRIGRQGEIRDRTSEGQHYRMAGLNLLAAIIIHWNTKHLGHAVEGRRRAGLNCSSGMLAHISPLGWAHILLTGEYRWGKHA